MKPLLVNYSNANELGAETIQITDYETIMEKVKNFIKVLDEEYSDNDDVLSTFHNVFAMSYTTIMTSPM